MSMFKDQPLYCPNCGKSIEGDPGCSPSGFPTTCSKECLEILQRKQALYILGKEYHGPRPHTGEHP